MVCGIQEDDEGPDTREDDEGPQEEAVHYHGHKLPVFLQLGVGRGNCFWAPDIKEGYPQAQVPCPGPPTTTLNSDQEGCENACVKLRVIGESKNQSESRGQGQMRQTSN